ncbi:MAG: flagellar motor stator protein MotA [Alphaproteobacteria bacterium]|nr:flagellar motor stator protein MotA [Alphaproteobacteria bacterium]
MLVIVGWIGVLAAVLGGYAMAGGKFAALWQPQELVIIGGAAFAAFLVGNSPKVIKATFAALPTCFKGSRYTKSMYLELLSLLFDILAKVRKEGLMSIESDVDNPEQSPVFTKYPLILEDHHAMDFLLDYLRLMVGGNLNAFEIENLMDNEIETHHHEGEAPIQAVARVGDGLPAFGIVAAVMGVVKTMGSVGESPEILGKKIGAALVGTFLGILLAYGFVSPLASLLEQKLSEQTKMLQCIKVTLLASLNGYPPQVAVEFGRKVLYSTERPTFTELEGEVKQRKGK